MKRNISKKGEEMTRMKIEKEEEDSYSLVLFNVWNPSGSQKWSLGPLIFS